MFEKALSKAVRLIILVITILFAIASMVSCYGDNDLDYFFAGYDIKIDPTVAILEQHSETITINGVTYDLGKLMYDAHRFSFECGFVCGDNLYVVKDYKFFAEGRDSVATHQIYEHNLLTGETQIFDWAEIVWNTSLPEFCIPFYYFRDRNVVVNDGINATKFNIDTYVVETVPASEYPKKTFIERGPDDRHITIKTEGIERELSVDYMAERHEMVKELTKLDRVKNAWTTIHPLDYFFKGWDSQLEEKIYLRCVVRDKTMDPITLVFTYDIETDEFEYVYNYFGEHHAISVYPVFEPLDSNNQ